MLLAELAFFFFFMLIQSLTHGLHCTSCANSHYEICAGMTMRLSHYWHAQYSIPHWHLCQHWIKQSHNRLQWNWSPQRVKDYH